MILARKAKIDFSQQPKKLSSIFETLSYSERGERLVQKVLPLILERKIKIQWIGQNLTNASGVTEKYDGQEVIAFFHYDGKIKELFVQVGHPLGLLLPILAHELFHAIDDEYLSSYQTNPTPAQRERRTFLSERRAYAYQYAVMKELVAKFPYFKKHLKDYRADGYLVDELVDDLEVIQRYGLTSLQKTA